MVKYAIKVNVIDNVVTMLVDAKKGEEVFVKFKEKGGKYIVNDNVPFGHKLAIRDIKLEEDVIKYGYQIGKASQNITTGDWVHIHNIKCNYKCLDRNGHPLPGQKN